MIEEKRRSLMRKLCLVMSIVLCVGVCVFLAPSCAKERERTAYTMNLKYDPTARTLSSEMTVEYTNQTDTALSALEFALYPNAFAEGVKTSPVSPLYEQSAYYKGKSYGGIEIGSVEGASYALAGEDNSVLVATLPEELYPDETATIKISFTTTLAEINARLGVGERVVNLTHFYPELYPYGSAAAKYTPSAVGDPFVLACADFDVTLTVPQELEAVFAGEGEKVTQNGENTYHVIATNVRDVAFFLGNELRMIDEKAGNITVEYCAFGEEPNKEGLRAAVGSLVFFDRTFGGYPYSRYVVISTDLCQGGMEQSGISAISRSVPEGQVPYVVTHETAHQWWYGIVGSDQINEAWQDEGLAEYSAALFFDSDSSYGLTRSEIVAGAERSYRAHFSVYSQLHGEANTVMSRPLTTFGGEYEY